MRRNIPLWIGLFLVFLTLFVAIFGPVLARHDPLRGYKSFLHEGVVYGGPPLRALPPFTSNEFPLGLDSVSRDVYSRLVLAVRPTLILCAVIAGVRLLIGVLLGVIAGWFGRRLAWFIETFNVLSGAIPLLIFAVIVLVIARDRLTTPLFPFMLALCLTGWINTAAIVQSQVQTILHASFIESAHAIGQTKWGIVLRYVLPQVVPLLPMLLASELSAVTLIVAELGYLGFFIGGAYVFTDSIGDGPAPDVIKRTTSYPELGQMLSDFFGQYNRTPWVSISAGLVMVLMLIGFTLTSEGLRRELDVTRPRTMRLPWRRRESPAQEPAESQPEHIPSK